MARVGADEAAGRARQFASIDCGRQLIHRLLAEPLLAFVVRMLAARRSTASKVQHRPWLLAEAARRRWGAEKQAAQAAGLVRQAARVPDRFGVVAVRMGS